MPSPDRAFQMYKWRWGLLLAAVQSAIYFAVGRLPLGRSSELLRIPLDDRIGLVPVTAWLYLPVYVAIFVMALVTFQTRRNFQAALHAFALIMAVGLAGHLLIGAQYPRPLLKPPFAGASERFLAWVQSIDPPGNVFPSLHVAHTSSLGLILYQDNPRWGRAVLALALLLAASTLTTKQHFIADVVAGFALAGLAAGWALRRRPSLT